MSNPHHYGNAIASSHTAWRTPIEPFAPLGSHSAPRCGAIRAGSHGHALHQCDPHPQWGVSALQGAGPEANRKRKCKCNHHGNPIEIHRIGQPLVMQMPLTRTSSGDPPEATHHAILPNAAGHHGYKPHVGLHHDHYHSAAPSRCHRGTMRENRYFDVSYRSGAVRQHDSGVFGVSYRNRHLQKPGIPPILRTRPDSRSKRARYDAPKSPKSSNRTATVLKFGPIHSYIKNGPRISNGCANHWPTIRPSDPQKPEVSPHKSPTHRGERG